MQRVRFVNPFDTRYDGAVSTVTRRDLYSPPPPSLAVDEITDDLKELNELVRTRIDVDLEPSPRPAKKRKVSGKTETDSAQVSSAPFRLFARGHAREISLVPKTYAERKAEWPIEDTHEERKLRRARAQEAAVDWPLTTLQPPKRSAEPPSVLRLLPLAQPPASMPALFVASVPKQKPTPSRNPKLDWSQATARHAASVSSCPTLEASTTAEPEVTPANLRKRRRRRPVAQRIRAEPAFWRAPPDLGGKSAGYALGWPASAPGAVGYVRSTKYTLSGV